MATATEIAASPIPTAKADAPPVYEARNVSKRYGNLRALNDMSFRVHRNEVVGLLGDNGAGKSTMIKMMSGIVRPDFGQILLDGRPTVIASRSDSERIGIETIYQDIALVDAMSITRNIFMGREITNRLGFMRHWKMRTLALGVLDNSVQISGIDDPNKEVAFSRADKSRPSQSHGPSISSGASYYSMNRLRHSRCARPTACSTMRRD